MAISRSMSRLLSIRQAEEEQSRMQMESALVELHHLEVGLTATRRRARLARMLVASSVQSGECLDRIAGLEEIAMAYRLMKILTEKIGAARREVGEKRQEFLAKRMERRQVETLCDAMTAQDAVEAKRKNQMALDDWHRTQRRTNTKMSALRGNSDIPLTR